GGGIALRAMPGWCTFCAVNPATGASRPSCGRKYWRGMPSGIPTSGRHWRRSIWPRKGWWWITRHCGVGCWRRTNGLCVGAGNATGNGVSAGHALARWCNCVLMVMVDDATNRVWAQFFEEETTRASYDMLAGWARKHGLPQSLYVDRDSLYRCEGLG